MKNTTNFHPTGTNLLLCAIPEAEQTEGGLLIPPQYRHTMNMGIVLELGPDTIGRSEKFESEFENILRGFEPGDTVVFAMHTEHRIQFNRKEIYYIIDQSNVVLNDFGFTQSQPKVIPPPSVSAKQEKRRPIGLNHPFCTICGIYPCDCAAQTTERTSA